MKKCIKCNKDKVLDEFSKSPTHKDGYKNKCKTCINEYCKEFRLRNYEKELERAKTYYQNNKDKKKEYAEKNKEKIRERRKLYCEKNKDKVSETRKKHYEKNKEVIKKRNTEYYQRKLKMDPLFKLKKQLKGLIRDSLRSKGLKKSDRTINILGCTVEEFKHYIESKFEPWMNWGNKGLYNGELNYGWDIDHIIPTSTATSYDEIIKLNHYTNLQPLCGYYNRHIKRDTI